MASVFKRGRDKGKRGAAWHFEFIDEKGKPRMRKGFTDKGLTQQLANKVEAEAKLRRDGLIDLEQEGINQRKRSLIEQHLLAFENGQKSKKNTEKHVNLTMTRVRFIVNGCEWTVLGDMLADDVEDFMTEHQEDKDISNRTYNHYLQAIDSFGNWLAHPKRRIIQTNPFAGIPRRNAEIDIRHQRRALTAEEFTRVLAAARNSGISVQCYSGEVRARIYTLSYMTGLRKGEIASLTKGSFNLQAAQPIVTVEAGASKHRRKDVLPLHPQLVTELKDWLSELGPKDALFPKLGKRKGWKLIRKDLELAGIPYRTAEGVADFHAAGRHTHITELLRNGATLPEACQLARHSDVRMTMKYAHIGIDDQAKALACLPTTWQGIGRDSTGGDGHSVAEPDAGSQDEASGGNNKSPVKNEAFVGSCQSETADAETDEKWRRRELNPRPAMHPRQRLHV
ncbi:hypothetical protein GCM10023156_62980 [Novipirellula rosea]|uniref:Tyr recombinase domain-containing protein n=1 Tax=Novipirellula rosea TaxID=1031540 RepID=A0ABP8NRD1_9BACT